MSDAGRLAVTVSHADGRSTRWGYDEVDSGVIPNDLQFSTSVPGGFKDASCSLLREIEPRADEALFDDLRIYGPGAQTAFEGRIAQMPRQGGRQATATPGAVGWSSHLEDYAGFREVYVSLGPSDWAPPPIDRRLEYAASSQFLDHDYTVSSDDGIYFSGTVGTLIKQGSGAELWFTMPPGTGAAKVQYRGQQGGTGNVTGAAVWSSPTKTTGSAVSVGMTLDDAMHTATLPANRYVFLFVQATADHTPVAGSTGPFGRQLRYVAVYGNHGLPLGAAGGAGIPQGVYASDVVADVIGRACPLLTFTTGPAGSIQPTTFAIPHLTFPTPTTAAEAISTANAYHGWDWSVWEDRIFHFQPQGSGVEWQARVADGAQLSLEGDTAEQLINGVIVSYTDGGVQKLAGPVGSGCDVESASLQDDATNNPVNAHGIPRRWPVLPISFPTTDAGAVELGAIYLAERNLAARKGQITLQGTVRHPAEGMVPVWRIRAGDSVIVTDRAGDVARRIVGTTYSHATRTVTLDCGIGSNKLDALLERVAVYTGALT